MKIKIFGVENQISCTKALKKAFVELGHEIVENGDCGLIYHSTGFFSEAIEYKQHIAPNAITIFCLLDANPLNPDWPVEMAQEQLLFADVPVTISKTARSQIFDRTGIECEVIYYPMKPVKFLNYLPTVGFLYIGRLFSSNKRFFLIHKMLELSNYDPENLIVVGEDKPLYGFHTGIVDDETLNTLYNSTQFVINVSSVEGVGMSMIEGAVCKRNLILTNDLPTVKEFNLLDFATDPNPEALSQKIKHIMSNQEYYRRVLDNLQNDLVEKFEVKNVAKRIIDWYNYALENKQTIPI